MKAASAFVSQYRMEIALTVAGVVVGIYLINRVFGAAAAVGDAAKDAAKAAAAAAAAAADKVNPASQNNLVQDVGTALYRLGDQKRAQQDLTLSTAVVDWFNFGGVNDYNPNAVTVAPTVKTGAMK